jgi:hypothetical protein
LMMFGRNYLRHQDLGNRRAVTESEPCQGPR